MIPVPSCSKPMTVQYNEHTVIKSIVCHGLALKKHPQCYSAIQQEKGAEIVPTSSIASKLSVLTAL